jgi:MutS domain V
VQPPTPDPASEYKSRQQAREHKVAQLEKTHRRFGDFRLLLVLATLIAAWFSLHRDAFSAWWLLLPVALFIVIAILHARLLQRRTCAERAVDFYRVGLARIEDRWPGTGHTGAHIDIHSSLYATDLDLFGPASLFQLLSLSRTRMGEETLAAWLLAPSPIEQLLQRQAAVAELRTRLDLREDLGILGDDLKVGVHPDALTQWAESSSQLSHPWLRWLSLVLAIAAIATAVLWAEQGSKAPFFTILIVEIIINASLRKRTATVLHATEHALADLQLLASLLARLEREHFESPLLQTLKIQLTSHHLAGSQAISRLKTIVDYIQSLDSPFMRLFDIPLLYTVQVAYAAEAWRSLHGTAIRSWLKAIGEFEALLSLSAYHYEHPADPFPEFIEGPPSLIAKQIGHPLIPAAKCVRNDISVSNNEAAVLLISGSNMSGKSTLMRSVGINTVLAMAGAPVRAAYMQLTKLQIGASILINDSLQEGSSRFYAEITRLRHICDLADNNPPVLFLLDELLQGTNSKDRLIGAEGVVNALVASGAIGLISTHDLALTSIGDQSQHRLRNVHLQDAIKDGAMTFDFKLHDGVVTKSNGIELMRLIGLKV